MSRGATPGAAFALRLSSEAIALRAPLIAFVRLAGRLDQADPDALAAAAALSDRAELEAAAKIIAKLAPPASTHHTNRRQTA